MCFDTLRSGSEHLFKLSAHEPLSDFLGAAANVVQFGVSEQSAAHVLVDIAVTTVELHALISCLDAGARCLQENRG